MAIVERDNVVLEIKESEVDRYIDLGYNLTDGKGNVIKKSIPYDVGELRKAYIEHTTTIEKLKARIAELEEANKPAPKKRKATKASEDESE